MLINTNLINKLNVVYKLIDLLYQKCKLAAMLDMVNTPSMVTLYGIHRGTNSFSIIVVRRRASTDAVKITYFPNRGFIARLECCNSVLEVTGLNPVKSEKKRWTH